MKVFLYFIGKPRDTHANAIATEFIKRSTRYTTCEMREINSGRFDPFARHPAAKKVLLDPVGRGASSAEFVRLFSEGEQTGQESLNCRRRSRRLAC